MPVIDSGSHRCEKCGKTFEWECFEILRSYMGQSLYQAETFPDTKLLVRKHIAPNGVLVYRKNCPYCDYDNEIPAEKEN